MTDAGTIGGTVGSVAGGALGGVIGGFLGGPVGAWIGRAVGSRLGRLAGAAAAEALANAMESANDDAEGVNDKDAAQTCGNCKKICFKLPENGDAEEFKKQLQEQQDTINSMRPDDLLQNMENYAKVGRGAGDAAARALARRNWIRDRIDQIRNGNPGISETDALGEAMREASTLDAIHDLDLGAGGSGNISGLRDRSANRSLGGQWGQGRADQLRRAAEAAKAEGKTKMDVKLEVCPEEGSGNPAGSSTDPGGSTGPGTPSPGSSIPIS